MAAPNVQHSAWLSTIVSEPEDFEQDQFASRQSDIENRRDTTTPRQDSLKAPNTALLATKAKRTACVRCRSQRVFCTKTKPSCQSCSKGKHVCIYEDSKRVTVSLSYLAALEARIAGHKDELQNLPVTTELTSECFADVASAVAHEMITQSDSGYGTLSSGAPQSRCGSIVSTHYLRGSRRRPHQSRLATKHTEQHAEPMDDNSVDQDSYDIQDQDSLLAGMGLQPLFTTVAMSPPPQLCPSAAWSPATIGPHAQTHFYSKDGLHMLLDPHALHGAGSWSEADAMHHSRHQRDGMADSYPPTFLVKSIEPIPEVMALADTNEHDIAASLCSRASSRSLTPETPSQLTPTPSDYAESDISEAVAIMQNLADTLRRERLSAQPYNSPSSMKSSDRSEPASTRLANVREHEPTDADNTQSSPQQQAARQTTAKNNNKGKRKASGSSQRDNEQDGEEYDPKRSKLGLLLDKLSPAMKIQIPCPTTRRDCMGEPCHSPGIAEPSCTGTNATPSQLNRSLLAHGIFVCQKCCQMERLGSGKTAESLADQHSLCRQLCINDKCAATLGLDLLQMPHPVTRSCKYAWGCPSMSTVHVWRYIYALIHNTNDVPYIDLQPGPGWKHTSGTPVQSINASQMSDIARELADEMARHRQRMTNLQEELDETRRNASQMKLQHETELNHLQEQHMSVVAEMKDKYEGKVGDLQIIALRFCELPGVLELIPHSLHLQLQRHAPDALSSPAMARPSTPGGPLPGLQPFFNTPEEAHLTAAQETPPLSDNGKRMFDGSNLDFMPSFSIDYNQAAGAGTADWDGYLAG